MLNEKIETRSGTPAPGTRHPAPGTRPAYFGSTYGTLETPVIRRGDLAGRTLAGPLIIEEYDATCLVPPACRATLDEAGNVVVDVGVEQRR